jgi:hypothetical protein
MLYGSEKFTTEEGSGPRVEEDFGKLNENVSVCLLT